MNKYLVVEVFEREVCSVTKCDTLDEAIATANRLLQDHIRFINYVAEFGNGEGVDGKWQPATAERHNAWCNWRGDWDAYIVQC